MHDDPTLRLAAPAPATGLTGQIGDYRIVARIGQGSTGTVYEAEHVFLRRRFALKVLFSNIPRSGECRSRFFDEVALLAGLDHPNIVKVHHAGIDGDRCFLAMDLYPLSLKTVLAGLTDQATLSAFARRAPASPPAGHVFESVHGPARSTVSFCLRAEGSGWRGLLTPACASLLLQQLLRGLIHAHGRGVAHRDIKPGNVLCGSGTSVVLADFGVARMLGGASGGLAGSSGDSCGGAPTLVAGDAAAREIAGTLDYMAPEVRLGRAGDFQSDLYSVGVLAYELFTGQRPYAMAKPPSRMNPDLPAEVDGWVDLALEPDPARRWSSAAEMLAGLELVDRAIRSPGPAPAPSPARPPPLLPDPATVSILTRPSRDVAPQEAAVPTRSRPAPAAVQTGQETPPRVRVGEPSGASTEIEIGVDQMDLAGRRWMAELVELIGRRKLPRLHLPAVDGYLRILLPADEMVREAVARLHKEEEDEFARRVALGNAFRRESSAVRRRLFTSVSRVNDPPRCAKRWGLDAAVGPVDRNEAIKALARRYDVPPRLISALVMSGIALPIGEGRVAWSVLTTERRYSAGAMVESVESPEEPPQPWGLVGAGSVLIGLGPPRCRRLFVTDSLAKGLKRFEQSKGEETAMVTMCPYLPQGWAGHAAGAEVHAAFSGAGHMMVALELADFQQARNAVAAGRPPKQDRRYVFPA